MKIIKFLIKILYIKLINLRPVKQNAFEQMKHIPYWGTYAILLKEAMHISNSPLFIQSNKLQKKIIKFEK